MQVTQTQRHSLTDNADGRRSETITQLRLYSPIPKLNTTKVGVQNDIGYTKIHGKSRYNHAKVMEIKDRVSM